MFLNWTSSLCFGTRDFLNRLEVIAATAAPRAGKAPFAMSFYRRGDLLTAIPRIDRETNVVVGENNLSPSNRRDRLSPLRILSIILLTSSITDPRVSIKINAVVPFKLIYVAIILHLSVGYVETLERGDCR